MFKIFKSKEKFEYTTQFITTDGNILVTSTDTLEVGSEIKMLPDVAIPDGIYDIKNDDESTAQAEAASSATTMINVLNGAIVDMPTDNIDLPEFEEVVTEVVEQAVEVEVEPTVEEVVVEDDSKMIIEDLLTRVKALEEMIAGININNDKFEKIEKFMLEGKTDVKSLFETEVKTDDVKELKSGFKDAFKILNSKF